jgi:16S rRNA C1402 N4-methylase RsmH
MLDNTTLKNECVVLGSLLRNELWKAYSDGGDLQWIKDIELLANIADSYYNIRAIMELSDKYYNAVQFATEDAPSTPSREVFQTLRLAVDVGLRSIQKIMREMDKHLL